MRLRYATNGGGRRRGRWRLEMVPWRHLIWWLATSLALAVLVLAYSLQPGRITLAVGDAAPRMIRSPITAKYLSRNETARLRREAEQRVGPQYVFNPYARTEALEAVDLGFDLLLEYNRQPSPAVRQELRSGFPGLGAAALAWAGVAGPAPIRRVRQSADAIVQELMRRDIRDEGRDLQRARALAASRARALDYSPGAEQVLSAICEPAIIPNSNYDEAATARSKEQARRSIKARERIIMAGDPIIYAGERVSEEHLEMLRAAGLINPRLEWARIGATLGICGLLMLVLAVYLNHYLPEVYASRRQLLLISLMLVLALATVYLLRGPRAEHLGMLTVAGGAMALGLLLNVQVGMMVAVVACILLGTMANNQLSVSALALGSSVTGLCLVPRVWPPTQSVRAAALLAGANMLLLAAVGSLTGQERGELGIQMALGGLYGLGAVVMAVGLVLVLQRPFEIVTNIRLLEFADPNHPLLKRLMREAPGSYSDSLMVANLAESAAEAAGGNGLLARVGAYYHDVGKLRRPYFFYENQALLGLNENVHDQISPSLSSLVITAHVRDGVELAREAGLPVIIQDIIGQHHGTSLVRFFYHRARSSEGGERVPEEMFRYPGPLPQSKEAAIVMLADAVFAAVWSLPDKNPQRLEQVVREVVGERLADGQLSASPLTLRDLQVVSELFERILKNVLFHTRIEYPDLEALQGRAQNGRADQKAISGKRRTRAAKGGSGNGPAA